MPLILHRSKWSLTSTLNIQYYIYIYIYKFKEHKRAVVYGATNVSEHALRNGHDINWENASILDHSDLFYSRLYLESWYIWQQNNVMNREVGILPYVYKGLMA